MEINSHAHHATVTFCFDTQPPVGPKFVEEYPTSSCKVFSPSVEHPVGFNDMPSICGIYRET